MMTIAIEQAYQFCPRCGQRHDSPGEVPFRCRNCQFTLYFGPVAAVGALVVNPENELLLVRRARDPGKGQWGLPGGFVDREETVEEALQREVFEETNLRLESIDILVTFPNHYNYHGIVSAVIDLFYVCRAVTPPDIRLEPSELDQYVWVKPDQTYLDNMAFASNRYAIETWLQQSI